ncbi:MAG TPA: lysophospholipid acyltransferase family protein [bacterium]|nr:lysophospholipid acyltransferase family protein [bacterium]
MFGLFLKLVSYYNRLEAHGLENIPRAPGSAVIAPNHSGMLDWDIVSLIAVMQRVGRWPHVLYWDKWYHMPVYKYYVRQFRAIPLSLENGLDAELLKKEYFDEGRIVCIFPDGTINSYANRYRLGTFYPGVIRLAMMGRAPVIPTAVIGVEKAAPVFVSKPNRNPKYPDDLIGSPVVLPFKVKVVFGEPMHFDEYFDRELTKPELFELAATVRERVAALIEENR